jgi:dihydrofolate synthase/folylpolyglutamate synthase
MSPTSPPTLPPLETLADAARYLDGLINRERLPGYAYQRLDLRPIHALLDGLGRPEQTLSVIHVAGSKGKGSTCLFAEAILLELGSSVGTFTSPHLESWVERFRLDGQPIDEARLVDAVRRVRPHVEALRAGPRETWPSFFDATTAIAFLLFAEAGVDRAVIEVGLGGRLDSTNVVSPCVTCITSIELEHTDKLGPTEAAIAGEKAGILKPGVVAILGPLRPEARAVVRARAEAVGAPVREWGEAFEGLEPAPSQGSEAPLHALRYVEPGGFELEFELVMPGAPARTNAALAIACVRALDAWSDEVISHAASAALSRARLPARIERLPHDPAVLIDSAHTARSARALADALATLAPKGFDLLLSVSSDKDLRVLLEPLLPAARRIWTTCADPDRSLPAEDLAARIRELVGPAREVRAIADPVEAIGAARAGLTSDATDRPRLEPGAIAETPTEPRMLCVSGSIYLAGLARRVLSREGVVSSEQSDESDSTSPVAS